MFQFFHYEYLGLPRNKKMYIERYPQVTDFLTNRILGQTMELQTSTLLKMDSPKGRFLRVLKKSQGSCLPEHQWNATPER